MNIPTIVAACGSVVLAVTAVVGLSAAATEYVTAREVEFSKDLHAFGSRMDKFERSQADLRGYVLNLDKKQEVLQESVVNLGKSVVNLGKNQELLQGSVEDLGNYVNAQFNEVLDILRMQKGGSLPKQGVQMPHQIPYNDYFEYLNQNPDELKKFKDLLTAPD